VTPSIATRRLDLVPGTIASNEAALAGPEALSSELGVQVPATWPPDYLDDAAFEYVLARLRSNPADGPWWNWFVILRGPQRTLVGCAGYKGAPSDDGVVEIGYGIVSDQRRRGFATEASRALIDRAFSFEHVRCVVAQTLPGLEASIAVMRKCGLRFEGAGSEPGAIRYRLERPAGGVSP
jgi:RimJ/RimL family protein N-acetyltransferase